MERSYPEVEQIIKRVIDKSRTDLSQIEWISDEDKQEIIREIQDKVV